MSDEIEIIEIDQWSSTGDVEERYTFDELKNVIENLKDGYAPKIEGGDAEAGQAIFGGKYKVKTVREDDKPKKGYVWYRKDEDGSLTQWKRNYATK